MRNDIRDFAITFVGGLLIIIAAIVVIHAVWNMEGVYK